MNSLFISTSLFYIICVFNTVLTNESNNSSICEIYASVTRTLSKEGFHRQLDYLVELTYFDSWEECSVCVEEIVPKGFYVNTDELTDLVRLGKLSAFVNETVDVELPWRLAKPHAIHVYTDLVELDNRLASSFSFPIHIRYHGAKIGGGGVFSGLNPPSVLLHCPKLACSGFNRVLPCSYTSLDKCLYKTLPNLVESAISVEVPVGNLDHYFLVVSVTYFTACFGSVYLLYILTFYSNE